MKERKESEELLNEYIENENLREHCRMVARAMEAYAGHLGEGEQQTELWWQAGLLHDLDWEQYPDEHPNVAVQTILPERGYATEVIEAVRAHAPERTGKEPKTQMERYLFACDEVSGFMNAVALMRPSGFEDMKPKSVKKKLKDSAFAANVDRDLIYRGVELIDKDMDDHLTFLIDVFKQ